MKNNLVYVMQYKMPVALSFVLGLGLVSALLSSASTSLITTATLIQNDILKKKSMISVRIIVVVIGGISTFIALRVQDIISILTSAYSIYTPGLVIPLFIAVWYHKKRRLNERWWILAVAAGGACGIINLVNGFYWLPLIGMGLSLVFGILSVARGKAEKA